MPSGSHMTSGGSHFNGGGASHKGSSSHSSGSNVRFRSGPMFIWIGRGRRAQVPSRYAFLFAMIPFFFVIMLCLFSIGGITYQQSRTQMKKIEVDRIYYLSMIDDAEANPQLMVNGTVAGKFYNEDCEKWYIEYEIPYSDASGTLTGQSFCVYSTEEISKFHVNDIIQIAVDSPTITKDTDSVPMDYKDIPLESDGEFLQTKSSQSVSIVLLCGGGAAFLLVAAIAIFIFVKTKQEYVQNGVTKTSPQAPGPKPHNEENRQNKVRQEKVSTSPKKSDTVNFDDPFASDFFKCPNCGASVTTDQKFCNVCGEKLKK